MRIVSEREIYAPRWNMLAPLRWLVRVGDICTFVRETTLNARTQYSSSMTDSHKALPVELRMQLLVAGGERCRQAKKGFAVQKSTHSLNDRKQMLFLVRLHFWSRSRGWQWVNGTAYSFRLNFPTEAVVVPQLCGFLKADTLLSCMYLNMSKLLGTVIFFFVHFEKIKVHNRSRTQRSSILCFVGSKSPESRIASLNG